MKPTEGFIYYLPHVPNFSISLMQQALKNEIKQRESKWSNMYWELVEPAVKIRTLRARLASIFEN